jgi:hypothetical protein
MSPPSLTPECSRGHPPGSSADRRLVAVGLVIVVTPFLLGVAGSVMIADEAIGPLITLTVWIVILGVGLRRANGGVSFVEWFAVVGCILVLQLLLDLHTRYLGDIVVAGMHVAALIAATVAWLYQRRSR